MDLEEKDQPERMIDVPFVSGNTSSVQIKLRTASGPLAVEFGPIKAFALGPASQTWTRYPRQLLSLVQKSFITAVMLPFTLIGVIVLARRRRWAALAFLVVVPIYYICVQSALWTEFRYILSIHYFHLSLRLWRCFNYQCSETKVFEQRALRALIRKALHRTTRRLGRGLPPHSAECLWLSAKFP